MLKVDYVTVAGATGCFKFKSPSQVDAWIAERSQPGGYRLVVTDKHGTTIGEKGFHAAEISWVEGQNSAATKPRAVLGCRAITVTLDEETILHAREIGEGNLSLGIRIAVAAMRQD